MAEPYRLPGSSALHNTDRLLSTVDSTSEKKDSNTMINDEPSILHSTSIDSSVIHGQYEDKLPSIASSSSSTTATISSPPLSSPNLSSPHLSPDRTSDNSTLEKNQPQPKKRKAIGPSLPPRGRRNKSTEEKNEASDFINTETILLFNCRNYHGKERSIRTMPHGYLLKVHNFFVLFDGILVVATLLSIEL